MAKYVKPSDPRWKRWQASGAVQTVVRFGNLMLQFNDGEQDQVVAPAEPGHHVQEVWVVTERASLQIEAQLTAAGYRVPDKGSEISNWALEKYCWLTSAGKCRSCGALNTTRGIEAESTLCQGCHSPTKGNWQEVYLAQGKEIPFTHNRDGIKTSAGTWPVPPCVQVVWVHSKDFVR